MPVLTNIEMRYSIKSENSLPELQYRVRNQRIIDHYEFWGEWRTIPVVLSAIEEGDV
jgi:hypothetical protein